MEKLQIIKIKLEAVLKYAEDALSEIESMIEESSIEDEKLDKFLKEKEILEGLGLSEGDVMEDENGRFVIVEYEQEDCSLITKKRYL